jgi:hypothetical protein
MLSISLRVGVRISRFLHAFSNSKADPPRAHETSPVGLIGSEYGLVLRGAFLRAENPGRLKQ